MGDEWNGAILTGGRSSRMGRDKALLPVDGVPMALRVARALYDAGASRVVCVGGDAAALSKLGLDTIDDEHPDDGPLGAFVTAMHWSTSPITVVTPCDILAPSSTSYAVLVSTLAASDALAAVPIVDGAWRAMPAALRAAATPALADTFGSGERAAQAGIRAVPWISVDAGPLGDADTPEQLERPR